MAEPSVGNSSWLFTFGAFFFLPVPPEPVTPDIVVEELVPLFLAAGGIYFPVDFGASLSTSVAGNFGARQKSRSENTGEVRSPMHDVNKIQSAKTKMDWKL